MTKRRRKKINKIMHGSTYDYIRKGKFEYLLKQSRIYRRHEMYLCKMNRRSFEKLKQELLENIRRSKI